MERELERLQSLGIIEPVASSEWAALIVAVPKKDGSICICGDYKVTINPSLDVDQYPLPKPEELFASVSGGTKFTKLDLSKAYKQMLLDAKFCSTADMDGQLPYRRISSLTDTEQMS